METYRYAHRGHTRTSHLTKLYSDAKKSAVTSLSVQPPSTEQVASLHRKYRIQKDRLITWGLAWSDDEKGPDGNIDESVARAGLTETVDSVLRNIKEVTDEAERIRLATLPGGLTKDGVKSSAKQPNAVFDEARYEDLLRDLTSSIDILYDLSVSRRALARGEHPSFNERFTADKPDSGKSALRQERLVRKPSFASSEVTLVNPAFSRPQLSPYAGLPPRFELSALRLPEEGPPPYEAVGVPSTTRMIAHVIRQKAPKSAQDALGSEGAEVPVLVEYANFDSTYRLTGVPPPMQRLEALTSFFQPMRAESQTNLSLLGYFEDPNQPRIGLVYDLPYSLQNKVNTGSTAQPVVPISLLKLVQKANKPQASNSDGPLPALEDRFRLALRLTEQLHAMHACGLAHGNINSSGVLFMTTVDGSSASSQKQMRSPLWTAFDLFSKCTVEGVRRPANLNIYKHPADEPQAGHRDLSSDIKYDLYGLGLILLEIGLWAPIASLYKAKYTTKDFKLRIEKIWIPKLAAKCGSAYMYAVQTCLQLSDESEASKLMVESIYGVLLQYLRRCCLLDDVGTTMELIPASDLDSAPSAPWRGITPQTSPRPSISSISSQTQTIPRRPVANSSLRSNSTSTLDLSTTQIRDERLTTSFSNTQGTISSVAETQIPQTISQPTPSSDPRSMPPETKNNTTQRFKLSSFPSSKDFKRRIIYIQQRWRARRAEKAEGNLNSRSIAISNPVPRSRRSEEAAIERHLKPKRKEYPSTKLPQPIVDDWHTKTCFELQRLVQKALKGSPESSSIALTAYGETPETARPTFLVCCTSTAKVKHVLKRHFRYDTSVYDVRVKTDEIRRCRRSRRNPGNEAAHRSMVTMRDPDVEKAANPDYQEQPLCGASIGAYRDDEHLAPVSFGGVVLVDGRPYGMSVHHMLEANDDEEENDGVTAEGADDVSDTSSLGSRDDASFSSEEDDEETVRPGSAHSSDDGPFIFDETSGDCPGIIPGDFEDIAITQPALDDAIDLDLHVDEEDDDSDSGIDEDHLLSYKLGQVHASSGLRRTVKTHEGGFKSISQSLPQEIDWALFELEPPRFHPYNVVKGGRKYCELGDKSLSDSYPGVVKSSADLACAKVHCLGRTSGLGSGVVSSTMELVKIHGRSTFSASWTVDGNFGVGGDSGAWVICNDDGKVCGHVLAARRGKTYICPMDLLLKDVKETLGATEVTLPQVESIPRSTSSRKGVERTMTEVFGRMRLAESERGGGGVALPANGPRPPRKTSPVTVRTKETVQISG